MKENLTRAPEAAPTGPTQKKANESSREVNSFVEGVGTEAMATLEGAENAESSESGRSFSENAPGKDSGGGTSGFHFDPKAIYDKKGKKISDAHAKIQVLKSIRKEIRKNERAIFLNYIGIRKISPEKLPAMLARLRQLKDLLLTAMKAAGGALRDMYKRYVLATG